MDHNLDDTARNKILALVDSQSFVEIGHFTKRDGESLAGDGVIAGYATINDMPVYLYSQDFSIAKGALSTSNARKICRIYDAAIKNGAPIIAILNSSGMHINEGVSALDGYASILKRQAKASGIIPQIAIAEGPCVGAGAVISQMADIVLLLEKEGFIGMNGPSILSANGMEETSKIAYDKQYKTEEELIDGVKQLISFLPQNNVEDAPYFETSDDLNRLLPASASMKERVLAVADNGVFLELKEHTAEDMLTGFLHIGGIAAGVVANAEETTATLSAQALKKAARFVRFCDCFNIPVLTFVNASGFCATKEQEEAGIASAAAQLAYAYASADIPLITTIAGKAIGSAYTIMGSHEIGADMVFALEGAQIAPLNEDTAAALLFSEEIKEADLPLAMREQKMQEYRETYQDPMAAAAIGSVDDVIKESELRKMLLSALYMQLDKRTDNPPRRHGNMPL